MNKLEFVKLISKKYFITRDEALKIINIFTDSVTEALSKTNELALIGFGSFSVSDVTAREGRNPKDETPMKIAAYKQARLISKKQSISNLRILYSPLLQGGENIKSFF